MKYIKAFDGHGYPVIIPVSRILLISIVSGYNMGCKLVVLADRMNANQIVDEYEYKLSEHKDSIEAGKELDLWLSQLNQNE